MLLLGSACGCWTGRTLEAVEYARQAHALFHTIGDRFGQAQALTALGRVLTSVGRVDEGLSMLRDALDASFADAESKESITLVTGLVTAAVHLGDPGTALDTFDRLTEQDVDGVVMGLGAGALEREVARGLALLQSGRIARGHHRAAPRGGRVRGPRPVDLRPQCAGAGPGRRRRARARSSSSSAQVAEAEHATYLDAATAAIAAAPGAGARDGDAEAASALDASMRRGRRHRGPRGPGRRPTGARRAARPARVGVDRRRRCRLGRRALAAAGWRTIARRPRPADGWRAICRPWHGSLGGPRPPGASGSGRCRLSWAGAPCAGRA